MSALDLDAPGSRVSSDQRPASTFDRIDSLVRSAGQALVDRYPSLGGPLYAGRDRYVRLYLRYVRWRQNRRHTAPIRPLELLRVDPDRIRYVGTRFVGIPRFKRAGNVTDGDWDIPRMEFTETDVYEGFEAHFERGVPWTETEFFRRALSDIERGRARWGCTSRDDLLARCRQLDRLYETIERDGYKSQRELLNERSADPIENRRRTAFGRLVNDEVAVDVGRNGELLFADGRNRLAIVKLLDLDEIPVMVLTRHEKWQRFRDRVAAHASETESWPTVLDDHPDLGRLKPDDARPNAEIDATRPP